MPLRLDSQTTARRKYTNTMPLIPVNTASITAAEPVAHGAVPHRIDCCCIYKNCLLQQVITLFEQHPYFVQRRSRASGYRRLAAAEYNRLAVWEHSPLFFKSERRLCRSWTVHRCCCSTSTVDSFSLLTSAFVTLILRCLYSIVVFS